MVVTLLVLVTEVFATFTNGLNRVHPVRVNMSVVHVFFDPFARPEDVRYEYF